MNIKFSHLLDNSIMEAYSIVQKGNHDYYMELL